MSSPINVLHVFAQVTLHKMGNWIQWSLKSAYTLLSYSFPTKKYLLGWHSFLEENLSNSPKEKNKNKNKTLWGEMQIFSGEVSSERKLVEKKKPKYSALKNSHVKSAFPKRIS